MRTVSDSNYELPEVHDDRSPEVKRFDAICDQVVEMNRLVRSLVEKVPKGQVQTVIHKTQGMTAWSVAAVVSCFFTILLVVLLAIIFVPDLHDLKAWQDILRKDVARIQAQQENRK